MNHESWGRRIWRLIYPGLTYYLVCLAVEFVAAGMLAGKLMGGFDLMQTAGQTAFLQELLKQTLSIALELQLLAAAISLPILYLYYRKDRKREIANHTAHMYEKADPVLFVPVVLLGFATCIAGNNLIAASGLLETSESFEQVAQILYGGKLALEFAGLGILIPIVEELIFRGLIYRRMREYLNIAPAAVLCSLIFGFYHGNLVQGVYAFFLSMLFIYVYERYHTMAAPILFHAAANLLSIAASELGFLDPLYRSAVMFWSITIISCLILVGMVWIIEKMVHVEEIPAAEVEAPQENASFQEVDEEENGREE